MGSSRQMNAQYTHELSEQRSRFVAAAVPAGSEAEVKRIVAATRKRHRKASHHPWACRLPTETGGVYEQARDDGEVGRPGMGLLELIRREEWYGVLIVSRYFGGVKLGPGGVSRACRAAAEAALLDLLGRRPTSDG